MCTRPSAGAGPVSRTTLVSRPQSALFLPWVADSADLKPAGTEGQLSSVPGAVVANDLPGFIQQTHSLGLHTSNPSVAGLFTWRLPASLWHASPLLPSGGHWQSGASLGF